MGQIQHRLPREGREGQGRQEQHLRLVVAAQIPHTFQPRLGQLPDGAASRWGAVYIFLIVHLLHHPRSLRGVFHHGQGDVRLQGQKLSLLSREGDEALGEKKIPIPDVQVVVLKPAHFVGQIPIALIQGKHLLHPMGSHGSFPPSFSRCRAVA